MNYLADTNVISELRRPTPNPLVIAWLKTNKDRIFLSVLTVGEIHTGIIGLDAGRFQEDLYVWFQELVQNYRSSILPVDYDVAVEWSRLVDTLKRRGQKAPATDSLIAATALKHGLTVATRNTDDFKNTGVALVNPFEA